jgi:hypothetical protein
MASRALARARRVGAPAPTWMVALRGYCPTKN